MILVVIIAAGCAQEEKASFEGYILRVDEGRLLVVEDISIEKYNEIKDKTVEEMIDLEEYIPLIYISYDEASKFTIGDNIEVWIDGGVNHSYPAQAGAKKIKVK